MPALTLRLGLAVALAAAAALKLTSPKQSRDALATFGLRSPGARSATFVGVVAAELAVAAGLVAGWRAAAAAGAALMLAFAGVLTVALRRGLAGAPCGCLGARSRVSHGAVNRNLALAAALALAAMLPAVHPSTEEWLGAGLALALLGVAGLAVGLLALAREVGELRLALRPQVALELDHEGPELGSRTALVERFSPGREARLALAVFVSEGCAICATLEPAIGLLRRDPRVAVEVFDEGGEEEAWRALDIPGSPYAVALALDGEVLAKGTFNTLPQLESVLATADGRRQAVGA